MDRRQFIVGAAAIGAATALVPAAARAQTGRVRRNVMSLKADDPFFADYAKAVTAMHQLPASDQRNWRNQALIHLNHCPHAAVDFVHWHRYYLTYFEQICGQLSGNPNFALPYWDWSYGTGNIPDPFYDVDALNVTYWNDKSDAQSDNWGPDEVTTIGIRILPKGQGVQSDPVRGGAFTKENLQSILASTEFISFWQSLETSPHNNGHVVVGGSTGHMGDGMSPLDPIFWLHHTMVDYMWASWQAKGMTTPGLDKNYSGQFVDGQGQTVTGIVSAGTLNYPALGYSYEGLPPPSAQVALADPPRRTTLAAAAPLATSSDPTVVSAPYVTTIPLNGARSRTKPLSAAAAAPGGGRVRAVITVGNAPTIAPMLINVFVNKPDANAQTPTTDPSFAGSFSFFGGHRLHAAPQDIVIDLSKALSRATSANASDVSLQLVPVMLEPYTGAPPTFTVRGVRVVQS